jgi:hypothetical protein
MRNDEVQVFCDVHHEPMELVGYRWSNGLTDVWDKWFCRCQRSCGRHFAPAQGYVDIRDDRIDVAHRLTMQCNKGHGSMAIVAVGDESELTWRCLHPDCREERVDVKARWVNIIERLPDYDTEVQLLVVGPNENGTRDIGYTKGRLLTTLRWDFLAKPRYTNVVAWLESEGSDLRHDELSDVPKDEVRF